MNMIKVLENGNIEISNVTPVEQYGEIQYFTTLISIEELAGVYDRLTYDGDTQRGMIDGKPVIDDKHVNSIYESLVNGTNVRGHLTWNMRGKSGNPLYLYSSDSNRLTIMKEQLVTLPDSAHRHKAIVKAAELEDEEILNSMFSLDIFKLNKTEEKEFFYTVNGKVKAPNRNRTLYLSNDIKCQLLRNVIAESDLDGKIECVRSGSYKDGKLTKFSTLYDSLFGHEGSFSKEIINSDNYGEYLDWFVNFYSELLNTRNDFASLSSEDKKKSKQNSMVLEEISWWGYAYLAKELMYERKWKHLLHKKMNKKVNVEGGNSVNFLNKTLPIWHATVIKPKYNFITKKQEIGTSVTNSNTTRRSVKQIFHITLF